jgi:2-(1,2-epoxy-1,2-dihydrophenyl)acetyl-CoA isomerase
VNRHKWYHLWYPRLRLGRYTSDMTAPIDSFAHLLIDTSAAGVRTITLNRPERLNAVNPRLADELPAAMAQAARDDAVRVVVITGAGRGFCAGLDLGERSLREDADRATRLDPYYWVGRWVQSITSCEKPVIAAVNGAAAGAGFGLALACDFRLVSASATITAGYVRRGLSPDAGVTWFLPRLIGYTRATDIILTGRDVRADEAERIGLATAVLADDAFTEGVQRYAAQLAAGPPLALALSKRLLLASADATLDAQLREEFTHIKSCFASADVREAMAAFKEKRVPTFEGR